MMDVAVLLAKNVRSKIIMLNEWSILTGEKTIFSSYKNKQTSECVCPEGISGKLPSQSLYLYIQVSFKLRQNGLHC